MYQSTGGLSKLNNIDKLNDFLWQMEPYLQDLGCTELACYLLLKMAFNYQMSADISEYITEEVKELFTVQK